MVGWSGGIYFHPVTSLFKKIHRIRNFSFNNILFSNIIMNNCNLLTQFSRSFYLAEQFIVLSQNSERV